MPGHAPARRSIDLPVTLAVSLHAPDDELRETLVPLNRRYPIAAVLDAAREYAAIKGRRVTFEYACIAGVNDDPEQADLLARRLKGLRGGAHVNLIPLNPTGAFAGRPPDRERINRFAAHLAAAGVTVTVRRNRGVDIDAACGQLRARRAERAANRPPGRRGRRRIRHNGAVNERRFLNRSQPQTLYMAVILCYIDVVFNLLGGLPGAHPDRLRARRRRVRHREREEVGLLARGRSRRSCRSLLLLRVLRHLDAHRRSAA